MNRGELLGLRMTDLSYSLTIDGGRIETILGDFLDRSPKAEEIGRLQLCLAIANFFFSVRLLRSIVSSDADFSAVTARMHGQFLSFYESNACNVVNDFVMLEEELSRFADVVGSPPGKEKHTSDSVRDILVNKWTIVNLLLDVRGQQYLELTDSGLRPNMVLRASHLVAEQYLGDVDGSKDNCNALSVPIAICLSGFWRVIAAAVCVLNDNNDVDHPAAPPVNVGSEIPAWFIASMPDLASGEPAKTFQAGQYLVLFLRNLTPISNRFHPNDNGLRYPYVLMAVNVNESRPVYTVTHENGITGDCFLCVFDEHGAHHNFGEVEADQSEREFLAAALRLITAKLGIVEQIHELEPRQSAGRNHQANHESSAPPIKLPFLEGGRIDWASTAVFIVVSWVTISTAVELWKDTPTTDRRAVPDPAYLSDDEAVKSNREDRRMAYPSSTVPSAQDRAAQPETLVGQWRSFAPFPDARINTNKFSFSVSFARGGHFAYINFSTTIPLASCDDVYFQIDDNDGWGLDQQCSLERASNGVIMIRTPASDGLLQELKKGYRLVVGIDGRQFATGLIGSGEAINDAWEISKQQ